METPLKKIRKIRKLSIYEVAKGAECSASNISRIERGDQGASPELAERISNFFSGAITEQEILYPDRFVDKQAA